MMQSYFEFYDYVHHLLFYGWTTHNVPEFIGTVIVVLVTAFLTEGLRILNQYALLQAGRNPLEYERSRNNVEGRPAFMHPLVIPASLGHVKRRKLCYELVGVISFLLRIMLAYAVMLFIMTYNAWFLIAALIGYVLGYYVFFGLDITPVTYCDNLDNINNRNSCKLITPNNESVLTTETDADVRAL